MSRALRGAIRAERSRLTLLLLLGGASASCAATVDPPLETESVESMHDAIGSTQQDLIGGGLIGPETQPAFVYYRSASGACSGTFVSPRHILTASHCLPASGPTSIQWTRQNQGTAGLSTAQVRAVHRDVRRWMPAQSPSIYQTIFDNDIAVIELAAATSQSWHTLRGLSLSPGVQGGGLTVAGYGCDNANGTNAGWRKVATLPSRAVVALPYLRTQWIRALHPDKVNYPYGYYFDPGIGNFTSWRGIFMSSNYSIELRDWDSFYQRERLVTTGVAARANLCEGDSGGPLMANGELVGVNTNTDFRYQGSYFERIDDHKSWLSALGVLNVPQPGATVVVHRSYNPTLRDHLQGLTQNEGAPSWIYEGQSFKLWPDTASDKAPLYRCRYWDSQHHFLSLGVDCEGQYTEQRLGFVSAVAVAGSLPIYRCAAPGTRDHLTTTNPNECVVAGFVVEGTQGHVMP